MGIEVTMQCMASQPDVTFLLSAINISESAVTVFVPRRSERTPCQTPFMRSRQRDEEMAQHNEEASV
jgi:hypothetical protein